MTDTPRTSPACPAPDAVAVPQLYRPGVPFAPTDRVALTNDEVTARAVRQVGMFGAVMFDKTQGA